MSSEYKKTKKKMKMSNRKVLLLCISFSFASCLLVYTFRRKITMTGEGKIEKETQLIM